MPRSAVATAARWMNSRRRSMGSPPRGISVVTHPQFLTFLKKRGARLAHNNGGGATAKVSFGPREFAHNGSRLQGQGHTIVPRRCYGSEPVRRAFRGLVPSTRLLSWPMPCSCEREESYRVFDEGAANARYARCDNWTYDTASIEVEYGRSAS